MATTATEPYGHVAYADPGWQPDGKKRYPIDTEEHARAALAYFSKPANQRPYTPEQVASIMRRIKKACRRFGIEVSDDTGDRSRGSVAESRATPAPVECRGSQDGQRIGGYAIVYGRRSLPLGGANGFIEEVDPGFFTDDRAATGWADVIARYDHDSRMLLGSVRGRTLRLTPDSIGVDYEVDLPTSRSDVYELVARGDVRGSSFTFAAQDDDWSYRDGLPLRILRRGRLIDVGPVCTAAYPDASVALRSLAHAMDASYEDVEMYSRSGELRRFFTRTDRPPVRRRTMSGAQAKAHIMGRRWPELQRRNMSGAQARLRLLARRPVDPIVPRALAAPTRDPRLLKLRMHRRRIDGGW